MVRFLELYRGLLLKYTFETRRTVSGQRMMPADKGHHGRGHYWTGVALSLWTYGRSFAVVHRDS